MKQVWSRHWIGGFIALSLVLGILGVGNLWLDVGRPFGGFLAGWNIMENVWNVGMPTPPWWPGIAQVGLSYGDRLVALDGRPYDVGQGAAYAAAYTRPAQSVVLTVVHRGTQTEMRIPVILFTAAHFLDIKLPPAIIGLGFWLLSILIYRTQPTEPLNRVAAVLGCTIALYFWVSDASLFFFESPVGTVLEFIISIPILTFTWAFITHFTLIFPSPGRLYRAWLLRALYMVSSLIAVTYAFSKWLLWREGWSPTVGRLDTWSFSAHLYLLVASILFLLVRLLWTMLHPRSPPRLRRQTFFVSLGIWGLFPALLLTMLQLRWGKEYGFYWSGLDLRALYLALPLAISFVILRYQTFKNTSPIFLAVLILAGSLVLADVGVWLVYLWQPQLLGHSRVFILFLGLTMIAGVVWSTLGSWQGIFGRLLYRDRTSYRAVLRFGQRVIGQTEMARLPGVVAASLVSELGLERAAVWLWQEGKAAFHLAGQAGDWPHPPPDRLSVPQDAWPLSNEPIRVGVRAGMPAWLEPVGRFNQIEIVVPLAAAGQQIGLLALGRRWDEEVFDERDLEIIGLIAQQTSLFLLTARHIEELRQVPQQIAEVQEHERFRIAQELHDSVQQFLGRLPLFLEVSRKAVETDPQQAERILQRCIADVEHEAQTMRQIRHNLAPTRLEEGLIQPLREMAQRLQERMGITIEVDAPPTIDRHLSLAARHALYRVVQQALDNAVAHAQARLITVSLAEDDGRVTFAIADDGRGSSAAQRAQAQAQGSFGLRSMAARIHALGGEFHFASAPNRGTQVSGWLPVGDRARSE